MKIILSIFSIMIGLFVILFWEVGSHGSRVKFRSWMMEDWIVSILIVFSSAFR